MAYKLTSQSQIINLMHKSIYTIAIFFLLFTACNSVKSTQKALNSGDYDKAIKISVEKLRKDKYKEKHRPYVVMLQDAYRKVTKRDEDRIAFLEKEHIPTNLTTIYNLYKRLKQRQQTIKPLLPLKIGSRNQNARFDFKNYDDAILQAKTNLTEYVYSNGLTLMNEARGNKLGYRQAYEELKYASELIPNYKNSRNLMLECHDKGTSYVQVSLHNDTEQIIPRRLEDDLLAINTYGLDNFWTVYSTERSRRITYDYGVELNFRRILVSPERIKEKEIIKERQIKDGFKYLRDNNGHYVKDSLGNKIKVDKFRKVRCNFYESIQQKSATVVGQVVVVNKRNNQIIERFPIESTFVFEHIYADYDGDKRALDREFLDLLEEELIPFPSNEQMVYDTGKDLKEKFKRIIARNKF